MFSKKLIISLMLYPVFVAADEKAEYDNRMASVIPALARVEQIRERILQHAQDDQQALDAIVGNREIFDLMNTPELRTTLSEEELGAYFPEMSVHMPNLLIRTLLARNEAQPMDMDAQEQVFTPQEELQEEVLPPFNDLVGGNPFAVDPIAPQALAPLHEVQTNAGPVNFQDFVRRLQEDRSNEAQAVPGLTQPNEVQTNTGPVNFQDFMRRLQANRPNEAQAIPGLTQPSDSNEGIWGTFTSFADRFQQGTPSSAALATRGYKRSREDSESESEQEGSPRKRARLSLDDCAQGRMFPHPKQEDDSDDEGREGHLYVY